MGQHSGIGEQQEGHGERGTSWPSEITGQVLDHCQGECWGLPAQETEGNTALQHSSLSKYGDLLIKPPVPSTNISGFSLNCVCGPLLKMTPPVMLPSWESRCH